jgi:hypothetical protein
MTMKGNIVTDFLQQKRSEIDGRLDDLRPAYEEYLKLERAKAALDELEATPLREPMSPAAKSSANGRRRRGSTHADRAVATIRDNPGITVAQLAPVLGIAHKNYLYRVLNGLQSEGVVQKSGQGYNVV